MRRRVSIRLIAGIALVGIVAAGSTITMLLRTPLVQTDQKTFALIHVGMSLAEVEEIIGGSGGAYDGIGSWSDFDCSGDIDLLDRKGPDMWWVGFGGEIEIALEGERVTKVAHCQIDPTWSRNKLAWERITRHNHAYSKVVDWIHSRSFGFLVSLFTVIVAYVLAARLVLLPSTPNAISNHGGLGILLGLGVMPAVIWFLFAPRFNEYSWNISFPEAIAYWLGGSVGIAAVGLLVGLVRRRWASD